MFESYTHPFIIMISVLFMYWSVKITIEISDWIMPATGINRSLVYGAGPVGIFFLILYSIRNFIEDMKNPRLHEEEEIVEI